MHRKISKKFCVRRKCDCLQVETVARLTAKRYWITRRRSALANTIVDTHVSHRGQRSESCGWQA